MMAEALIKTLLVNSLVFAALFGVVMALRAALRTRLSATLSLALWAVLALKLALPFGFESVLSPFGWFASAPPTQQPVVTTTATAQGFPTKPLGEPQPESISLPLPITATHAPAQPIVSSQTVAAVQPSTASAPLRWTDWALLIWASGAAGVAMWLLLGQLALNRRLRAAAEPTATALAALHSCKAELGIRTQVALRVLPGGTPAVAGVLRPTVLLADGLDDADALRPVLLHELNHFRNGDLLAILLMNFLTVIYWFHPLVWALFALVRRDMETRCDQQVLSRLSREGGLGYVSTLLRFSGYGAGERLRAALGMGSGRALMERRIRDMFRSRRADAATRAVTLVAAVVLLAASLLTACQPTPEKPAVINKNQGKLESAIRATAAPTATPAAPGTDSQPTVSAQPAPVATPKPHIKEQFQGTDEKVTITVDADVIIPDLPIPIVKIQPRAITMDMVRQAAQVLCEGNTLYEPKVGMTKAELQTEILKTQAHISDWKKLVAYYSGDEAAAKDVKKEFSKRIQDYQKQLASAPETIERKETDWTFRPIAYYTDMAVYGNIEGSEQEVREMDDYYYKSEMIQVEAEVSGFHARMKVANSSTDSAVSHGLYFTLGSARGNTGAPEWNEADDRPMTLTKEQTAAMVSQTLEAMGLKGYALHSINASGKAQLYSAPDSITDPAKRAIYEAAGEGRPTAAANSPGQGQAYAYHLVFVPTYGDIPTGDASYIARNGRDKEAVGPYYGYETLRVDVKNDRIVYLRWNNPSEPMQTENDNVQLLPTDEVMAAFRAQMRQKITLDWLSHDAPENEGHKELMQTIVSGELTISKVELALWRMRVKDQPNTYRIVPIWRFYGTEQLHYKDGRTSGDLLSLKTLGYAWINGLDGSVFDPYKGY